MSKNIIKEVKTLKFLALTKKIVAGLALTFALTACYESPNSNFAKQTSVGQWRGYEVIFLKDGSASRAKGLYLFKKSKVASNQISEGLTETTVGFLDNEKTKRIIFVESKSLNDPANGFYALEQGSTLEPLTTTGQTFGKSHYSVGQHLLGFENRTRDLSALSKDELISLAIDIQKFATEKYPDVKIEENKPKPF